MTTQLETSVNRFIDNEAKLNTFVNGNNSASYRSSETNEEVPSISNFLFKMLADGFYLVYSTQAELLASTPTGSRKLGKAMDTKKVFLWNNGWTDTGSTELEILKAEFEPYVKKGNAFITDLYTGVQQLMVSVSDLSLEAVNHTRETKQLETVTLAHQVAIQSLFSNVAQLLVHVGDVNKDNELKILNLLTSLQSVEINLQNAVKVLDLNLNDSEMLTKLLSESSLVMQLSKLEGFNPKSSNALAIPLMPNLYSLPTPRDIVRININIPTIPTSKADPAVKGTTEIIVDGVTFKSHVKVSVQGTSSAILPKKNFTFAYFADASFQQEVQLKIGNVLPHAEWVYKCNYIDKTQTRNLFNNRLWDKMQSNRTEYPLTDMDMYYVGKTGVAGLDTSACGHPAGYVCILSVNDTFYGLGNILIGKKRENYNMDTSNVNHVQVSFGRETTEDEWFNITKFTLGSYELRCPKKPSTKSDTVINNFKTFANLAQAQFTAKSREVFDTRNIVDFYIFTNMIGNWDATYNNTIMHTWDSVKWYMTPYDLDQSLWNWGTLEGDVMLGHPDNEPFWSKVKVAYSAELTARWTYLRKTGTLTTPHFLSMFKEISGLLPKKLIEYELAKWDFLIGGQHEYMDWFNKRLNNLDTIFGYIAE